MAFSKDYESEHWIKETGRNSWPSPSNIAPEGFEYQGKEVPMKLLKRLGTPKIKWMID